MFDRIAAQVKLRIIQLINISVESYVSRKMPRESSGKDVHQDAKDWGIRPYEGTQAQDRPGRVDGLIAFGGRLSGHPGLMESRLHIAYKRNACTGTQLEERS